MPETAPRELMVLVERVVRPLPLPFQRQKRLRTELLQHLESIFAEELARNQDHAAAVQRTRERFGDPEKLTAELRHTIRWDDRVMSWCEQKQHESLAAHAFRVSMSLGALMAFAGILLHIWLVIQFGIPIDIGLISVTFLLSFAFVLAVLFNLFLYCSWKLGEEGRRPDPRWNRIAAFAGPILAIGPICLAAGHLFTGSLPQLQNWGVVLQLLHLSIVSMVMVASGLGWAFLMIARQHFAVNGLIWI